MAGNKQWILSLTYPHDSGDTSLSRVAGDTLYYRYSAKMRPGNESWRKWVFSGQSRIPEMWYRGSRADQMWGWFQKPIHRSIVVQFHFHQTPTGQRKVTKVLRENIIYDFLKEKVSNSKATVVLSPTLYKYCIAIRTDFDLLRRRTPLLHFILNIHYSLDNLTSLAF